MLDRAARFVRTLLFSILLLAGFVPPANAQQRVAVLELDRPPHSPFLLRATIPVPAGVHPRADGTFALGVIDHALGKPVVPLQQEVVTRYPDGQAAVLEVLARVSVSKKDRKLKRLRYSIVAAPHKPGPAGEIPNALKPLSAQTGGAGILLRTQDVFGNEYRFNLTAGPNDPGFGSMRWTKQGPHQNELRVAGALAPHKPFSEEGAPLLHMMGVHAYMRTSPGDKVLELDLRIHNGLAFGRSDPHALERPVGSLYWTSLELVLPKGFTLHVDAEDPFFGSPREEGDTTVIPIVSPMPTGALHFMPPQAQFQRRFTIAAPGSSRRAEAILEHHGLAFPIFRKGLWSWNNERTANYFPQRDRLASMDFYRNGQKTGKVMLRADAALRLEALRKRVKIGVAGDYPADGFVMGWAHPWFITREGGHGGEDVQFFEGHRAAAGGSRHEYSRIALLHRMNTSRQPQALWNLEGDPVGFPEWVTEDGALPFDYRMYGRGKIPIFKFPCRGGRKANAHYAEVERRGLRPIYDQGSPNDSDGVIPTATGALVAWMPHDCQHLVRYTKNCKALAWLGNDSLAKDDLQLCAELYRLMLHDGDSEKPEGAFGHSLLDYEALAKEHPNQGLPVGRETAWGIDAMCAAYQLGSDEFRERNIAWLQRVTDLLEHAAPCNGILPRTTYHAVLNNAKYEGTQSFENALLLVALRSLHESCWDGVDEARASAVQSIYFDAIETLYFSQIFQQVKANWTLGGQSVYLHGPRWAFAVALNDGYSTPVFCDEEHWGPAYMPEDGYYGGVEAQYGFTLLSFAADWSAGTAGEGLKNRYLARTLDLGMQASTWSERYEGLIRESSIKSLDQTQNLMGYLARLQSLSRDN